MDTKLFKVLNEFVYQVEGQYDKPIKEISIYINHVWYTKIQQELSENSVFYSTYNDFSGNHNLIIKIRGVKVIIFNNNKSDYYTDKFYEVAYELML